MIGKIINERYKVLRIIGGGGMSVVYLATDLILNREVAVKVLRSEFSNNLEYIRRFNREGQAASSLSHPNIVSILDVGEGEGLHFLVMEFIDGMTLKEYIQTFAPIPMERVMDIMRQLISAIAHAHKNNIIHRDIKPHNVMVDKDGTIKVTDFGIATAVSAATLTQTNSALLGSVHYLSPEQARGGQANNKSDIYSLGIVMFEMLTGQLPFSGDSAVSIALKHLQTVTPSTKSYNSAIPQSIENVVLKATAKNPANRYQNVEEMQLDIDTALDGERIFEKKYIEPVDDTFNLDDATKVLPVITQKQIKENLATKSQQVNLNDTPKKSKKKMWWILGSLAMVLIIAVLAFLLIFTNVFRASEVEVPDLTGMDLEKAIVLLNDKGLEVREKKPKADDKVPENTVIDTNPSAGEKVKKGSKVTIYYSTGAEKKPVADYRTRSFKDLESIINGVGYKNVETKYVTDDIAKEGTIIEQKPAPGEQVVLAETTLELTISKGKGGTILDYQNRDYKDLESTINGIGFKNVEVKYVTDIIAKEGTIIAQKPAPGEQVVLSETTLELTISKGKEKLVLRDLTEYTKKLYDDYAKEVGISIRVTGEQYHATIPAGSIISQDPVIGAEIEKGSEVKVVVSKGQEPKPDPKPEKSFPIEIKINYDGVAGAPQTIKIYIKDKKNNMIEPVQTFTIVDKVSKTFFVVLDADTPTGKIRVTKDNKIVHEETVQYQ